MSKELKRLSLEYIDTFYNGALQKYNAGISGSWDGYVFDLEGVNCPKCNKPTMVIKYGINFNKLKHGGDCLLYYYCLNCDIGLRIPFFVSFDIFNANMSHLLYDTVKRIINEKINWAGFD